MKLAYSSLRSLVLAVAALGALASSAPQDRQQGYPPPYQQPYADPNAGAYGGQAYGGAPGQDYCFSLTTPRTTTSICGNGFGPCERQRQDAIADGDQTTECVPWQPVACFQLGGDPAPASRFCAANLEDCELWRTVDQQKNGSTGGACAWKQ